MKVMEAASKALLIRSRSRKELFIYLKKKNFEESEIEFALDELEKCGYLSDERFCEEYLRYAFGKKWSKQRAFKELKLKGVSSEIIENAYEQFLEENERNYDEGNLLFSDRLVVDEYERALDVASKIVSGIDDINDKIKGRVARRLAGYGYSADIIYRVLGDLQNEI